MNYRAEIDGLRAIAVIPVILFHAGFEVFRGGFVGVDVFFVISGYLITSIIINEMESGRFSITGFYERRARRILPAMFFVMLICIPFAWYILIPSDLIDFGQSLIAVSTFSSNFLFWSESGYFDTAAELKPLLHTWSLAVEEQYYIIFPIFLLACQRLHLKWTLTLLIIIFFISLTIAQWGAYNSPSATFYLLPTRGWELLLGVFLAYLQKLNYSFKSHWINQTLSLIGLSLVTYSVFTFDESIPFPGLYALIPTLGTCLIILSALPRTFVFNLLTLPFIVSLGLVSYSSYLWHQPILAFSRHLFDGDISNILTFILCACSILMAYFSYRYIEKPFRNKDKFGRKFITIFSLSGILLFTLSGLGFASGFIYSPNKIPGIEYISLRDKLERNGSICKTSLELSQNKTFRSCEFGSLSSSNSVILFGDSHAESISFELDRQFKRKNIRGIWIYEILSSSSVCDTTIFTVDRVRSKDTNLKRNCIENFRDAMNSFPDTPITIIVNRWTMKYYPIKNLIDDPYFNNEKLNCRESGPYVEFMPINTDSVLINNIENKKSSIRSFLDILPKDKYHFLIYPIPEIGCDIYKLNSQVFKKSGKPILDLSFPVEEYLERNFFINEEFNSYFEQYKPDNILPVYSEKLFCRTFKENECSIIHDSLPLYLDDDHLSDFGSSLLVNEITTQIKKKLQLTQ